MAARFHFAFRTAVLRRIFFSPRVLFGGGWLFSRLFYRSSHFENSVLTVLCLRRTPFYPQRLCGQSTFCVCIGIFPFFVLIPTVLSSIFLLPLGPFEGWTFYLVFGYCTLYGLHPSPFDRIVFALCLIYLTTTFSAVCSFLKPRSHHGGALFKHPIELPGPYNRILVIYPPFFFGFFFGLFCLRMRDRRLPRILS